MKSYLITVPVTHAHGRQQFVVQAANEKAALKAWAKGEAECIEETFEIDGVLEPKIELNE